MEYLDFDNEANNQQKELGNLSQRVSSVESDLDQTGEDIDDLKRRIKRIQKPFGVSEMPKTDSLDANEKKLDELNSLVELRFPNDGIRTNLDKQYELKTSDYVVASIVGGIGVVLDFLVVKIPQSTNVIRNGKRIYQKGSSVTDFFRRFGADKDGKTWKWIELLEKHCKVPYDKSIDPLIKSMCPKVHRFLSLAHDASPLGLLWAIKDITNGTFSYIDGNGLFHVEKITESSGLFRALTAPIIWLGHIISDIFTKAGIPIPGWCYLNLLQFGSFGDKQRTIAEVARYMYYKGYDLRHLMTMSIEPAVIGLILHIYHFLVNERPKRDDQLLQSEKEYYQLQNNIRYRRMRLIALSVASCGNVAKIVAYEGNPLALNFSVWYEMIKESMLNVAVDLRLTKDYETVIENRHVIDENFEYLFHVIEQTNKTMFALEK